jgi:hypothetical protein
MRKNVLVERDFVRENALPLSREIGVRIRVYKERRLLHSEDG